METKINGKKHRKVQKCTRENIEKFRNVQRKSQNNIENSAKANKVKETLKIK